MVVELPQSKAFHGARLRRQAPDVGQNITQLDGFVDGLGSVVQAAIAGLQHPLTTPAHVIALAGLALVAGRDKRNAIEIAFAFGLAIGLGALARGPGETPAVDVLLAGATLYGVLAASAVTMPVALAVPVAFLSGIALGFDSPPESISHGEAAAALIGTACGAVTVLALMAFLAFRMASLWRGIVLRAAGSCVAAAAMLALVVRWGGGL